MIRWEQNENRIKLITSNFEIFFDVPEYIKLDAINKNILKLIEILLFHKYNFSICNARLDNIIPDSYDNFGLAFSGGKDSLACSVLLPPEKTVVNTIKMVKLSRPDSFVDNSVAILDKLNTFNTRIITKTDFGKVYYKNENGRDYGYKNLFDVFIPLLFFVDYYKIKYLVLGATIDYRNYMPNGAYYPYDMSYDWLFHKNLFAEVGLKIYLPFICVTEGITAKISEEYYPSLAIACEFGEQGISCGKCYNCWRNEVLKGNLLFVNDYIVKRLDSYKYFIYLYSLNYYNIIVPELKKWRKLHVPFFDKYYKTAFDKIVVDELKDSTKELIDKFCDPIDNSYVENFKIDI